MELRGQLQYRFDENGQRVIKGIISGFEHGGRPMEFNSLMDFDKALERYSVKIRPPKGLLYYLSKPAPNTIRPFDWSTVPGETKNTLRPYQKESIEKIVSLHDGHVLLAIEMGKGKTAIATLTSTHYPGNALFVVKKSNIVSTADEYERWTGRDRPVIINSTTCIGGTVTVANYECAKKNQWILQQKWSVVVFDESHTLMNPASETSRVLLELTKTARAVILMSATPRKGCNSQIYNQLLPIVGTSVLGTYVEFTERYCSSTIKRKHGIMQRVMGNQRFKAELNILLQQCSIRLTSADTKLPVSLFRVKVELELPKNDETTKLNNDFYRYKMTTNQDMKDRFAQQLWQQTALAKAPLIVDWVLKWLTQHPQQKIAVFFHHQSVLAQFVEAFVKNSIPFAAIHAKTSVKKRNKIIKSLSNESDHSIRVGLLSILTCSLGITLCPGVKAVAFAQLIHSPTDVEQCECKVYRLGAKEDVNSFWFVAKQTYDESMIKTLVRKKRENGEVMDGEEKLLIFEDETLTVVRSTLMKEGLSKEQVLKIKISPFPNESAAMFVKRIGVKCSPKEMTTRFPSLKTVETDLVAEPMYLPVTESGRATDVPVAILKPRSPVQKRLDCFLNKPSMGLDMEVNTKCHKISSD
jgi:SNF2 family DNA or RNA helicase